MASKQCVADNLRLLSVNPKFVLTGADSPAIYEDLLKDIPDDLLTAAVRQYLSQENKFTPIATPGVLREMTMDLQMQALGVPTGGEAWGMVMAAGEYSGARWCEIGAPLRDAAIAGTGSKDAYNLHMDSCTICRISGLQKENYGHPVVAQAVKLLGGRDAVVTDNPVADRARLIDAYRELVLRERTRAGMTPDVRGYVQGQRDLFDSVDPVYRLNNGISDVVEIMERKRKDLE